MKRFSPLLIWAVISFPLIYFVRNVLVYKYPEYSMLIMGITLAVVLGSFFVIKDRVLRKK
jgi:hypothetical protein